MMGKRHLENENAANSRCTNCDRTSRASRSRQSCSSWRRAGSSVLICAHTALTSFRSGISCRRIAAADTTDRSNLSKRRARVSRCTLDGARAGGRPSRFDSLRVNLRVTKRTASERKIVSYRSNRASWNLGHLSSLVTRRSVRRSTVSCSSRVSCNRRKNRVLCRRFESASKMVCTDEALPKSRNIACRQAASEVISLKAERSHKNTCCRASCASWDDASSIAAHPLQLMDTILLAPILTLI